MGGTTHRLQCQWVGMHGTGWACCVWAAWGVGMYTHASSASLLTERCSTLPGGWGRVGTAFSPSVTQETTTPNLFHLGSPSLSCHLLCFTQSLSPKGAHFWCPSLPHSRWGLLQQSLPGQMLLVEALIALGRS